VSVAPRWKSLVGSFASVAELKWVLLRDLTRQVRLLQPGKPAHPGRIDRAREITELIKQHKQHGITINEYAPTRAEGSPPVRVCPSRHAEGPGPGARVLALPTSWRSASARAHVGQFVERAPRRRQMVRMRTNRQTRIAGDLDQAEGIHSRRVLRQLAGRGGAQPPGTSPAAKFSA
jgi:hypothetical protein